MVRGLLPALIINFLARPFLTAPRSRALVFDHRYDLRRLRAPNSSRARRTSLVPYGQLVVRARAKGVRQHSSLTTPLKSPCTTSSTLTVAICTGRVSGACACEGLGDDSSEFPRIHCLLGVAVQSQACLPPRSPRAVARAARLLQRARQLQSSVRRLTPP
jgi:hypothetical protein